jgi:pimeloyl-ACP methyl ester carboxylesterase
VTGPDAASGKLRIGGVIFSYQDAGSGTPIALLHGIGSVAASFRRQVQELSTQFRVLAWDAPGYGDSTPLPVGHPNAGHYAAALDAWLGALDVGRCHLVGHSLGALIAARFVAEQPRRVLTLTLAAPASGHGRLPPSERQRLLAQRLDDLTALGAQGMASRRGPRLLGPDATEEIHSVVVETMARIRPDAYEQAARMLSTGDIEADLARLPAEFPIQVIVGDADAITTPAACSRIATVCRVAAHVVPRAGHALYLEKPELFNRLLANFATAVPAS